MQDPKQMAEQIKGYNLVDAQGKKLGTVESLWVDGATKKPEFLAVKTGSGGETKIVPYAGARPDPEKRQIQVTCEEKQISSAPHFEATANLTEQDEEKIYKHYGVERSTESSPTGMASGGMPPPKPQQPAQADKQPPKPQQPHQAEKQSPTAQQPPQPAKPPVQASAQPPPPAKQPAQSEMMHKHDQDDPRATRGQTEHGGDQHTMQLEEERLKVSKTQEQAGEVRLGKKVTEETKQVEVPVREEKVTLERRPGSGQAKPGEITDSSGEIKVPLTKERVDVTKETVVAEEIGVRKESTERKQQVSETLRKEELDMSESGEVMESEPPNPNAPRPEQYQRERSRS